MKCYLKDAVRWLGWPIISLALLAAIPALANQQNDERDSVQLLAGWWMGKYKMWNINSRTYTESNLYLIVV